MESPKQIFRRGDHRLTCFIQPDAPQLTQTFLQVEIERHGGIVLDAPLNALVIIIVDVNSPQAAKMIGDYSVSENQTMSKGVVRYGWVAACIDAGIMLGPRNWGGYAIYPLTLEKFFEPPVGYASPVPQSMPGTQGGLPSNHDTDSLTAQQAQWHSQHQDPREAAFHTNNDLGITSGSRSITTPLPIRHSTIPPVARTDNTGPPHPRTNEPKTSSRKRRSVLNEEADMRDIDMAMHRQDESDDDEPPPPVPREHFIVRGRGRAFTANDKNYIKAVFEWASRRKKPMTTQQIHRFIADEMTWHGYTSITAYTAKQTKDDGTPQSPGSATLASTPSSSTKKEMHSPKTGSSKRAHTPFHLLPYALSSWPEGDEPPIPPSGPLTTLGRGRVLFTNEDDQYVISYIKWCFGRDPTISRKEIIAGIGASARHHPKHSWESHLWRNRDWFISQIPTLERVYPRKSTSKQAAPNTQTIISVSSGTDSFYNSDDDDRPLGEQASTARTLFTEDDFENVAQFLAENPRAFVGASRDYHQDDYVPMVSVWEPFYEKHPHHSIKSWIEWHRRKAKSIEKRATEIMREKEEADLILHGYSSNDEPVDDSEVEIELTTRLKRKAITSRAKTPKRVRTTDE